MRHQDACGFLSRQSPFRSDAFVEQMQTDVRVDGTQWVVE